MKRRLAVVAARAARAVRGLWPDRNPLRRSLDRVEAVIAAGLVAAFLVGIPLAALTAGHLTFSAASRTAHAEQSWHQVPAVLLANAPDSVGATVRARWAGPNGSRHTGAVPVPPTAKAGSTVMVWIDAAGRQTSPPLQPAQASAQALLAAVFAPMVLGFLLLCVGLLVHTTLGRRRLAAWDADWQATEPQWTRRRSA